MRGQELEQVTGEEMFVLILIHSVYEIYCIWESDAMRRRTLGTILMDEVGLSDQTCLQKIRQKTKDTIWGTSLEYRKEDKEKDLPSKRVPLAWSEVGGDIQESTASEAQAAEKLRFRELTATVKFTPDYIHDPDSRECF